MRPAKTGDACASLGILSKPHPASRECVRLKTCFWFAPLPREKLFGCGGRAGHCPPEPKSISRRGFGCCNPVGHFVRIQKGLLQILQQPSFCHSGPDPESPLLSTSRGGLRVKPAMTASEGFVFFNSLFSCAGRTRLRENAYTRTRVSSFRRVNPASRECLHSHTCPR